MINLLKADFFRVLKTKIVYISLIIAVVLPFFVDGVFALTEKATMSMMEASLGPGEEAPSLMMGETILGYTFSPLMSFSFVFAIFPVIVILNDFVNGTIRNKVIHGYNRHQIFAAHFIISLIYSFVLTTLTATTNAICAATFLGLSPVDAEMIPIYFLYYVIGLLGTLLTASIGCGLALSLLNAGAIILTVVLTLFFSYLGSLLELLLRWQQVSHPEYYLCFLPTYFPSLISSVNMTMQTTQGIEPYMIIESIVGILILSGGFYALGTFVFNKRDFK